jgi:hypothetical protein
MGKRKEFDRERNSKNATALGFAAERSLIALALLHCSVDGYFA